MCSSICQFACFFFQFIELPFHIFWFFWHNFWSSTQFSFSASRCSSENMKTSLHQRVSHWLSVSQTSQSITRNILLLNLCLKYPADGRSLLGWLWSINSDLRWCSKTRQQRTFFIPWWPFPPLASLFSLDDAFWHLPSDLRDLRRKKDRKMTKKKGNETRKKVNFLPWKHIVKHNFFLTIKISLLLPSPKNNGDSKENQKAIKRCFSRKNNFFYKEIIENFFL